MGYRSPQTLGDVDAGIYAVLIYHCDRPSQEEGSSPYPWLVSTEIAGQIEMIYIKRLPDLLHILNLCAVPVLAGLLTQYSDEYSEVLEMLTRNARGKIQTEHQMQRRQAKK